MSGDFTTKTGLLLGNARFLAEQLTPTALTLTAKQAVLAYQTQPVDTLAKGGETGQRHALY